MHDITNVVHGALLLFANQPSTAVLGYYLDAPTGLSEAVQAVTTRNIHQLS